MIPNPSRLKEIIEEGGFVWEILSTPLSTNIDCSDCDCSVKRIDREIKLVSSCNLWFDNWIASEVWIRLIAEIDGCNVKNARILPSSKSYIAWYIPRKYTINLNRANISAIAASFSGCENCCELAKCIDFDVTCSAQSWIGNDVSLSVIIRLCGNGIMQIDNNLPIVVAEYD